ncbi:hypothetical protein L6E12_13880 [Actinokineospora sp. PR83]|uniref:hypothetical protein n=1 Tax=Actinokineospora sp. PR83 TaxID=2884908 RepID=UPI001F1F6C02|nr:hypothetical protein [Actinokineospora sp. PR83]MCG8916881.1 hypothetical protein [Actinokineospora sp. PR83]
MAQRAAEREGVADMGARTAANTAADLPYQLHARWRWIGVVLGSLILLVSLAVLGLDDVLGFVLAAVFIVLGFVLIDTFYNSGVRVTAEAVEERSILVRSWMVEWDEVVGMEVPAGRVVRRPVLLTRDGDRLSLYSLAFLSLGRERAPSRIGRLRHTVEEMAYDGADEYYEDDEDFTDDFADLDDDVDVEDVEDTDLDDPADRADDDSDHDEADDHDEAGEDDGDAVDHDGSDDSDDAPDAADDRDDLDDLDEDDRVAGEPGEGDREPAEADGPRGERTRQEQSAS